MSERSSRQHAGPSPSGGEVRVPETSYAERGRTLLHLSRVGSLSTLSRKQPGWPFGSIMPYGLDRLGRPSFLISSMAMHTQNILADARTSLLVTAPEASTDPLGAARISLIGNTTKVEESEVQDVRDRYLAVQESAKYWVDFNDFAFYRMDIIDIYYVGGFGVMGWVAADDYVRAEADPLADSAASIIKHMNADHAGALLLLARSLAGIEAEEAVMTSVDRLGFHLRLKTPERVQGARIPFPREVRSAQDARTVFVEMVQQAKQRT